ncbi:membrane protein insertion efficiency factor YidD [Pseudoclavibacter albus]|uniref:membrane protein insertion efficiency factor YidD n=1 Tax=Pseudoclavibacter albus TaxID=272241 RepID=UPI0009F8C582|nr:membrane protein insertion efficiency factor YidD [Pseudoclavibacter alba]
MPETLRLLPRNCILAFFLTWRTLISPLYGDVCRYHPTCSAYGVRAVQWHGAIRGSWMTVRRIARCHPWARGGIDDVPAPAESFPYRISSNGFVTSAGRESQPTR